MQQIDVPDSGLPCGSIYNTVLCGHHAGCTQRARLRASVDIQINRPPCATTAQTGISNCFLTFLRELIEILVLRPKYFSWGRKEGQSLLGRLAKWTGVIRTDRSSSLLATEIAVISSPAYANSIQSSKYLCLHMGLHL